MGKKVVNAERKKESCRQGHPTPLYTSTPTPTHKHLDRLFFHFSTRTDRRTNRPMDGLMDKASHRFLSWKERDTVLLGWTIITWDIFKFKYTSTNSVPRFWEKCKKCEKIKKDLKNHSSKTIDCTEFCLASSERGELALSELLISCVVSFGPKSRSTFPNSPWEKGKSK